MRDFLIVLVVSILVVFMFVIGFGSMQKPETYKQKVARIEKVCAGEYDPKQCELVEIARIVDQQQEQHQKDLDNQVGN